MNNVQKKSSYVNNKEPIPIHRNRLRRIHIFNNVKFIFCIILITLILFAIGCYYIYSIPYTSIVVDANSSVSLKLNRWNKVISASALDANGNTLLNGTNLKFKNVDYALITIVNKAEANDFIKMCKTNQKCPVIIYISGNSLNLSNFYNEFKNRNYGIQINENGIEKLNNLKNTSSE